MSEKCCEKLASLAYFGRKIFKYAHVSPENFLTPPPVDNISGKNFYNLVKILLNVGQNMTTPPPPPPPNVDAFATSLDGSRVVYHDPLYSFRFKFQIQIQIHIQIWIWNGVNCRV